VPRLRLLIELPSLGVPRVASVGWQPIHPQVAQDPPYTRIARRDVVVALEVHHDLERAEVIVLAQVDDLADHVVLYGEGAVQWLLRAVPQSVDAEFAIALQPLVEAAAADAVVPTRLGNTPRHLLGMPEDG